MNKKNPPVRTGFTAFDKMTNGLNDGDLICIASRPSMGKTSLALKMAANILLSRKPKPVLLFSLDSSPQATMERMIAAEAKVGLREIRSGLFPKAQWPALTRAGARYAGAPLYLSHKRGMNLAKICKVSRRMAAVLTQEGSPLRAIFIDALEFIGTASNRKGGSAVVRALGSLARELRVPIVLVSRVSADADERPRGRPRLADTALRDADVVALVYREGYYRPHRPELETKAELILAKNARGKTGSIRLRYSAHTAQFKSAQN